MIAGGNGHREIAQLLVDRGADVNTKKVRNCPNIFRKLCVHIRFLRDSDLIDFISFPQDGWTALMLASSYGHREIAQLLVDRSADVNTQRKVGKFVFLTCLLLEKFVSVNRFLRDSGISATSSISSQDGQTALMCASRYGHREIAQLLVDRGADVSTQEKVGS